MYILTLRVRHSKNQSFESAFFISQSLLKSLPVLRPSARCVQTCTTKTAFDNVQNKTTMCRVTALCASEPELHVANMVNTAAALLTLRRSLANYVLARHQPPPELVPW